MIELHLEGRPIHKMRHRTTKNGHIYDPQVELVNWTKWEIKSQYRDWPLDATPLKVEFSFMFEPPISWSKKRKDEAINLAMDVLVKPDLSNLVKFYEDCMNGLIYTDDAQIVDLSARKVYAQESGTIIIVEKKFI